MILMVSTWMWHICVMHNSYKYMGMIPVYATLASDITIANTYLGITVRNVLFYTFNI